MGRGELFDTATSAIYCPWRWRRHSISPPGISGWPIPTHLSHSELCWKAGFAKRTLPAKRNDERLDIRRATRGDHASACTCQAMVSLWLCTNLPQSEQAD